MTHLFASRVAKPAALGLALLSFIFLLQVTPHGHASNQDDPACLLCQVAHVGVAPAISAPTLNIPLVPMGEVAIAAVVAETESFFSHFSSRAPPSLPL